MNLSQLFTKPRHRRVLSVLMPGGDQFHALKSCLSSCPAWRACNSGGPDETLCTDRWAEAEVSAINVHVLAHVANRFDHYNAGDQALHQDSAVVGELREMIRDQLDAGPEAQQLDMEGRIQLRMHRTRERGRQAQRKKEQVLASTGRLACEVCDFDFAAFYGPLACGSFAECHHQQPLSSYTTAARTSLDDLAIVCSNCHSVLHLEPSRTVAQLRGTVEARADRRFMPAARQ